MLYNPDWNRPNPNGDIWSLDNFIAWLETKDRNGIYNYTSCYDCLIAQYLKAMGKSGVSVGVASASYRQGGLMAWLRGPRDHHYLPEGWDRIASHNSRYGDALKAAKKLRDAASPEQILRGHSEFSFALEAETA